MGPTWSPKAGFGLCCGFLVNGYENNGQNNSTIGASGISTSRQTLSVLASVMQNKGKKLDMGPTWSPKAGFGLCCGFPVNGYENNGQSNGTSGGSGISPSGWLFNICNETSRCDHQPAFPLAQYFLRLWEASNLEH